METPTCDHRLTLCNDSCRKCGEPMGDLRRKWKRVGRPWPWSRSIIQERLRALEVPRMQCKDLPTLEVLFAMWAWHEEARRIDADRDPSEPKRIALVEGVRKYPPSVDKVMMHVYGVPEKLVYAKLNKLERQDLIEYGGTIRLGWPTEKGLALLREAGLVDPP